MKAILPRAYRKACAAALLFLGIVLTAPDVAGAALSVGAGGCLFALILTPLSRVYERLLPRGISAALAALTLLLLLAGGVLLFLPMAIDALRDAGQALLPLIRADALPDLAHFVPEAEAAQLARGVLQRASGLAAGAYRLFLMLVLGCFITASREAFLLRLELLLPLAVRRRGILAAGMIRRELLVYARGQGTVALSVGALSIAGFLLLGIPNPVPIGIMVGIFNLIPYIGPFLGGIPAVGAALAFGWQRVVLTVLTLILVQQADSLILSPRVLGGVSGISPGVVMLAVFVGGRLAGVAGMVGAVPVLMAVRTLYRVFVQLPEKD